MLSYASFLVDISFPFYFSSVHRVVQPAASQPPGFTWENTARESKPSSISNRISYLYGYSRQNFLG